MVAQAQMEQAHLDNMEQLRETINRQHQQDIEATKKHMENEMKEVWIHFLSLLRMLFYIFLIFGWAKILNVLFRQLKFCHQSFKFK